MLTINELIEIQSNSKNAWLDKISFSEANSNKFSGNFYNLHLLIGVNSLIDKDFLNAKINFTTCALIDELRINRYNNRIFDYGLPNVCYAILTDDEALISRYANLKYFKADNVMLSMDEMVLQGESAIWCNTVQLFIIDDVERIKRNMNILETITLKKLPKNQQELKIDYEYYKALLIKDKSKCEEILDKLVSPKIHKKRNGNAVLNQYVSQPALGYAKLAWRLGIEVDVNSSLVPIELLPIQPLDNYEVPYDFLKGEIS